MNKHHENNIKAYDEKADNYNNTLDGRMTEKFKRLLVAHILDDASAINEFVTNTDVNNLSVSNVGEKSTYRAFEPSAVLDVGCGNGTLLSKLSSVMNIVGFGIDLSPQMIASAKALNPEFTFAISSCESIPFNDNSMDIITVCCAYHHFPDVKKFASEVSRLLKAGGHLYVADITLPIVIRQIVNLLMPLSKGGDVKIHSQKEIASVFEAIGFRLVSATKRGHIQIIHFQKI